MSQTKKGGDATTGTNGVDSDCEENKPQKRQLKHDSGAADLEKVTDYMEDSEISSQNIAQVCLFVLKDMSHNTCCCDRR